MAFIDCYQLTFVIGCGLSTSNKDYMMMMMMIFIQSHITGIVYKRHHSIISRCG